MIKAAMELMEQEDDLLNGDFGQLIRYSLDATLRKNKR